MLRKALYFALIVFPMSALALDAAQSRRLIDHLHNKQFVPVEKFLKQKRKSLEKEPEYYVVLLNYIIAKYVASRTEANRKLVLDGLRRTRHGLRWFSNRLDIHIGAVAVAERIGEWEFMAEQLIRVIQISRKNNNQWKWGYYNSMTGEPKQFMLGNVQRRTYKLFYMDNPKTDVLLIKLSRAMIKHYPKHVYGYSNLGTYYLAKKDYVRAEKYLKKALQVNPDDRIVKANLKKLNSVRRVNKK